MIETYPLETPAVRPLNLHPARLDGRDVIVVQDPLGILEGTAVLAAHPLLLVFFQLANGQTTFQQMAEIVTRAAGTIVGTEVFESIAKQLDQALLLASPRFREAYERKRQEYRQLARRPSIVFRAEGMDRLEMIKKLSEDLRSHFKREKAPPASLDLPARSVIGILSPHIDYDRGGHLYAWAYKALREYGTGPKTCIILGTSHKPLSHRFVATRKDFETPLGVVQTDLELLNELADEFGGELFEDEFAHASEHSVELQALYLRHTFGESEVPKIVPILVGSFEEMLADSRSPGEDPEIAAFCGALSRILERHGEKVAVIAGVDFSHCGPHFGQMELNDPERESEIEGGDRAALAALETGEPDRFFDHFRKDGNANQVCSIAPIYVALAAMQKIAAPRVLAYDQANSEDRTCLVSFASVAFLKKDALQDQPRIIIVQS